LLLFVHTLLGASILIFVLLRLVPGDIAEILVYQTGSETSADDTPWPAPASLIDRRLTTARQQRVWPGRDLGLEGSRTTDEPA